MFKWIKNLFSFKSAESSSSDTLVLKDPIKESKKPVEKTPVSSKAEKKKAKAAAKKGYTQKDLEKMDKTAIDELAAKELGIKLDRRKKKETMIEEFLKAQK